MTKILTISIIGLVTLIGAVVFFMNISVDNQEITLREKANAQTSVCKAYYDKMWKILKQKAGVTDQYKDAFAEIYPKLIEGRYSQGDGSLMKWIQESNPNFDNSLYKDLMNSIEIEREGFFNEQKKLIDIKNEHSLLLKRVPSKWFIDSGITELEIIIITSTKTEKVFETGKDDDIELFDKK
jgi:hypothetical protein